MRKKSIILIVILCIILLIVGIFLLNKLATKIPVVPKDFTATVIDRTRIKLNWTKGDNADTTYIERNLISSWIRGEGTLIYNDTGISYLDTVLPQNRYYYQAWSWNQTNQVFSTSFVFVNNTTFVNQPLIFTLPRPVNSSTNNPLSFDWNIQINDPEGNTFTWTIQCSNGQNSIAIGASNGTKSLALSSLAYSTTYIVWVNATDPTGSNLYTRKWFTFTTEQGNPVLGMPSPANGSIGNLLDFSWSIPISDPQGDLFSWTINCSNGQKNSSTSSTNGTKSLLLKNLAYSTTYKIWVNATDPTGSNLYTRRWYIFTTKTNLVNNPPLFGGPSPANGSTGNLLNLSWSIPISDPQGNLFSWTIQCSNGKNNSGSGASNGTKTLVLSGLKNSTSYKVWVNATDPTGSNLYTRRWYIFTTKTNLPPVFFTPSPANGSIGNLLGFTWSIPISDPQGDPFSWTIQCSNGQTNNDLNATNGIKTLSISDLEYSTTYKIWVNATDQTGSGLYTRKWYTFTTLQQKIELNLTIFNIGSVDAKVTNTGEADISSLSWEFDISRNATLNFRDINLDKSGVIASLPIGRVETISSDQIGFKFGRVTVKVTVSKNGVITPKSITAQAFLIGPIIIILPT